MKSSSLMGVISHDLKSRNSQAEGLKDLIKVKSPYFALKNLHFEYGELTADIPLEQTSHLEPFGMSTAEVGRHLAILGSLALANINPIKEPHYYLASDAILERCHARPGGSGVYSGKITSCNLEKRRGEAQALIYSPSGELFYNVEVKYTVLTEEVFNRMFKNNKLETKNLGYYNPYRFEGTLHGLQLAPKKSTASMGVVLKKHCIGHFDNFPAMPVARLGGTMAELAGLHLNNILNNHDQEYCMKRTEIHAKSFIFAGKKINLESVLVEDNNSTHMCTHTFAHTNDTNNAAELKLWYY